MTMEKKNMHQYILIQQRISELYQQLMEKENEEDMEKVSTVILETIDNLKQDLQKSEERTLEPLPEDKITLSGNEIAKKLESIKEKKLDNPKSLFNKKSIESAIAILGADAVTAQAYGESTAKIFKISNNAKHFIKTQLELDPQAKFVLEMESDVLNSTIRNSEEFYAIHEGAENLREQIWNKRRQERLEAQKEKEAKEKHSKNDIDGPSL